MAGKRYGYLVIACLIMLVLGLIYAWSIFVVPLEADPKNLPLASLALLPTSGQVYICGML